VGIKEGQAYVDENRCIFCGKCVVECPQGAKAYRKDIQKVRELLAGEEEVVAAVAPSFAGLIEANLVRRFPSALRLLGFSSVVEVAEGAYYVTKEYLKAAGKGKGVITTSCPAAVEFASKYRPELLDKLIPVPSPMIAQAKLIKRRKGPNSKVVFIGPCVAKKMEADLPEYKGLIDAAITLEELFDWFETESIDLNLLEESGFDMEKFTGGEAYCISGGMEETAAACGGPVGGKEILCLSSFERTVEAFNIVAEGETGLILEPLVCSMGCINGPGIRSDLNILRRKMNVQAYANSKRERGEKLVEEPLQLVTSFHDHSEPLKMEFSEDQIREVLQLTAKFSPEDELNCGACGYESCRDNARAVLTGMAETGMCIPYMRRFAERRADEIIERSPNGIIVLDRSLNVVSVNEAFKKMFLCTGAVIGKHISLLMDPDLFERMRAGTSPLIEETVSIARYSLTAEAKIFRINEDNITGVFVDITGVETGRKQLDELRNETLKKAEELLEHQIATAQVLAKILGEGTAKSEALLDNLMKLTEDDNRKGLANKNKWLWDIYTSK